MLKVWTKEEAQAVWPVKKAIDHLYANSIFAENGCLEWQGPKTSDGYGQLGVRALEAAYGIKGVHRLMVHLVTGHVFQGRKEHTLHSCDNRQCCNPAHLSVGTAQENKDDAMRKGRVKRGEDLPCSILTNAQVREIKDQIVVGETVRSLADRMGVNWMTIYDIKRGKSWKHI
jgi:hypothetical protein